MKHLSSLLNKVIMWSLIIATAVLIITSILVKDVGFIKSDPIAFLIELLFISVISSLIICVVFAKTRNVKVKDTITWFLALMAKFAIFHVLFQLSGVYSAMFDT